MQDRETAEKFLKELEEEEHLSFLGVAPLTVRTVGNDDSTPLHVAAYRGEVDASRALIFMGADVNAKGDLGKQPLHDAASSGVLDICKALVAAGADLDVCDELGLTPLMIAKMKGKAEVYEFLKEAISNSRGH